MYTFLNNYILTVILKLNLVGKCLLHWKWDMSCNSGMCVSERHHMLVDKSFDHKYSKVE